MKLCRQCARKMNENEVICSHCGCKVVNNKSIWIALLLWFFLGGIGAHRFYVGDMKGGALCITLLMLSFLVVPSLILIGVLTMDLITIVMNGSLVGRELD